MLKEYTASAGTNPASPLDGLSDDSEIAVSLFGRAELTTTLFAIGPNGLAGLE
jgi:hypothetical protein